MKIENSINGWRIVLNTTEFLIGDFSLLDDINNPIDYFIPPYIMIDNLTDEFKYPNYDEDLLDQRTYGIPYTEDYAFKFKMSRRLSNYGSEYPLGRHFHNYNTTDFTILWYGFSPMNDRLIERKVQIKDKMSNNDKLLGRGQHHIVSREQVIEQFKNWQTNTKDLKEKIKNLIL